MGTVGVCLAFPGDQIPWQAYHRTEEAVPSLRPEVRRATPTDLTHQVHVTGLQWLRQASPPYSHSSPSLFISKWTHDFLFFNVTIIYFDVRFDL